MKLKKAFFTAVLLCRGVGMGSGKLLGLIPAVEEGVNVSVFPAPSCSLLDLIPATTTSVCLHTQVFLACVFFFLTGPLACCSVLRVNAPVQPRRPSTLTLVFCFCLICSDAKSILGTIYKVSLFWIYHS